MIATHFSENFSDWGIMLLQSIAHTAPNEDVIIFGINLSPLTIGRLYKIHNKTMIHNYIIEFDGEQKRYDGHDKKAEWKILMQNIRPYFVLGLIELLNKNKTVIYMDADMLLRTNLNSIYNIMRHFDVGLYANGNRFKAGLMAFNIKSVGYLIFAQKYFAINQFGQKYTFYDAEKGTRETKISTQHYQDQNCLKEIHAQLPSVCNINLWELNYNIDTPLWSAHRGNKDKAKAAFRKELDLCQSTEHDCD